MTILYGAPESRSLRVAWMLEELQLEYDYERVALMKGEGRSERYLAINPGGKVPALQDGEVTLTESAAIVTWLGDKHRARDLVPEPGTPDRGRYDQWCHFAMSELEQPLWTIGKHRFAIPEQYRVKDIFPTAEWEFQGALSLLSKALEGREYILGSAFSAADILLAHTLLWADAFKQSLEAPGIREYMARATDRPALVRALERESGERKRKPLARRLSVT